MNKRKKVFGFKFNNKKILIKDYIICNTFFSKVRGLMFRKKSFLKPLLFIFSKPGKYSIHSFFCHKFIAVWMLQDGNKIEIIDVKKVLPYKFNVTPQKKFNLLLEIPVNSVGKRNI